MFSILTNGDKKHKSPRKLAPSVLAKITKSASEITSNTKVVDKRPDSESYTPPLRTSIPAFLGDAASEDQKIRKALNAQQHFAYEEFPDPQVPSGINCVIHPIATVNTNDMSVETLQCLEKHLRSTLHHYGPPKADSMCTTGADIFPRLRFRSLVAVSWALHELIRQPLKTGIYGEMVGNPDFPHFFKAEKARGAQGGDGVGPLLFHEWKVEGNGDVVDEKGETRFDSKGRAYERSLEGNIRAGNGRRGDEKGVGVAEGKESSVLGWKNW